MIPKAIILDFDGVVIESVGVKDEAFRKVYADRADRLPEIMAYSNAHNATIRFDKFRHISEQILGEPLTDDALADLSARFSAHVFAGLVGCPLVPGVRAFFERFHARAPLFLASVSPAEELARVLEARDLAKWFTRVYPHPWIKRDAIADILKREGIAPGEAVFVGDTPEDYGSAHGAGVPFIGRDSGRPFGDVPARVVANLFAAADLIEPQPRQVSR